MEKIDKVRRFDPESCYDFSDLDQDYYESFTGVSPEASAISKNKSYTQNLNSSINKGRRFRKSSTSPLTLNSAKISNKNVITKKMFLFKRLAQYLDVLVSVLMLLGYIISQIEHENYYWDNLNDRSNIVRLIQDLDDGVKIISNNYNVSFMRNEQISNLTKTAVSTLSIPMTISDYNRTLRLILLFQTLICIPLIIVSKYIEYLREYVYKKNLEGMI